MNIDNIREGIVIDHIKAQKGIEIYHSLNLDELDCSVALITNAKSKKMGKKDIIKIDKDVNLDMKILGYIDHNITINIIKNERIVDKYHVEMPKEIVGIIECKNPRCITSVENELQHIFVLADKDKKIYRCKYCDMSYT